MHTWDGWNENTVLVSYLCTVDTGYSLVCLSTRLPAGYLDTLKRGLELVLWSCGGRGMGVQRLRDESWELGEERTRYRWVGLDMT